ncbi:MAG: APC family permease [Acidobacteria bacterium]|nr:APC family permease [Acidobacteriota bacterium]
MAFAPDAPAGLRRSLSFRDLLVYGLLFIGPLAPVGVFGVLDARTDGAVATVYLAATAAMGLTAWSYATMAAVVPHAGSVFAYATHGLGTTVGFLAGWLALLDYLLIPSVAYLFSGIALHALVPAVPAWVFATVAFVVTTTLNFAGVRVAARVGWVVLVLEVLVLGLFLVGALAVVMTTGPSRPWSSPFASFGVLSAPQVMGAVSIAVLSYLGFDAIAGFAEETTGASGTVGRAITVCLVLSGVLFVLQTLLGAWLSPWTPSTLAAAPARQGTAFYDMVRSLPLPGLATAIALTKAIGPAFAAMAGQAAAARLLFGMARDGRLPAALASVSSETGTPQRALVATAGLTLLVSVVAARRDDGLAQLVSLVDVGALAAFALLHASVIGYFVHRRLAPWGPPHVVIPLLGLAVTGWVLVEASPFAQALGLVWGGIGLLVALGRRTRRLGDVHGHG